MFRFLRLTSNVLSIIRRRVHRIATRSLACRGARGCMVLSVFQRNMNEGRPTTLLRFDLRVMRDPFNVLYVFKFRMPSRREVCCIVTMVCRQDRLNCFTISMLNSFRKVMLSNFMSLRSRASGLMMLSRGLYNKATRIRAGLYSIHARVVSARQRNVQGMFLIFPCCPSRSQMGRSRLITKDTSKRGPFRTRIPFYIKVRRQRSRATNYDVCVSEGVVTNFNIMNVRYFIRHFRIVIRAYPYRALSKGSTSNILIARLRYFFKIRDNFIRNRECLTRFGLPGLNRLFPGGLGAT